ncbi:MAG: hypothetical protein HN729_01025 [Candidatus Marinimicrobia bacterium]|nr:hypothetical protein [Candidatus Neomarinimicrobiota bacterium]MBT3633343.1 hypothetical protein [Candidatus Neomarinimicrobiota bacterium]MBT3681486.1 hypothetical protein [Candidatus Neomarinimicrobiota bacterium]MBT3758547.1 hypothetical protein [Candidatus Neomarinimicrobiota bacterium]MBT3894799.1 hypothetical protein [Candidatus Neomarinimicrobiota bacterium]
MVRKDKIGFIITHFRVNGEPVLQIFDNPTDCLIRTILSQSTTDANRDNAFRSFKNRYSDLSSVVSDDIDRIAETIRVSGIAKKKASAIQEVLKWCKQTFDEYSLDNISSWDDEKITSELIKINGIGYKTIAILLCFSLGRDVFPVDVHVHRIITRLGITRKSLSPDKVYFLINPFVPFGKDHFLHVQLVKFGRERCRSQNPLCVDCPFSQLCDYNLNKNDWA